MPATVPFLSSTVTSAVVLADASAPVAPKQPASSFADTLPLLGFMVVIFYFMLIRPQQKRAKEQATLISSIKSGDRIITTGGLHGIVANARDASDKTVLVKFAENVKIEVEKSHITTVAKVGIEADAKAIPAKTVV